MYELYIVTMNQMNIRSLKFPDMIITQWITSLSSHCNADVRPLATQSVSKGSEVFSIILLASDLLL